MANIKWTTPEGYLGTFAENTEVSIDLEATNPVTGNLTYTLLTGELPPGLQIQSTGTIYGYPQVVTPGDLTARSSTFTVRARNGLGQVADRTFEILVNSIVPPVFVATGVRGESVSSSFGNIDLSFANRGSGYFSANATVTLSLPTGDNAEPAVAGPPYLFANGAIKAVPLLKEGSGYTSVPTIKFFGANTVAADATVSALNRRGVEDLGTYFDGDSINLQINLVQVSPTGSLTWKVVRGQLPPGLALTQTGLISGFALAPAAPGPAGSGSYDSSRYDEYVWDYEGYAEGRTYQFSVRVTDGINFVDQKYTISILDKTYFLIDNVEITADTELYTADRDGYQYPVIITQAADLPAARQNQNYAFKFESYYSGAYPVKWRVNSSGPALFDQGAIPSPDDNNNYYTIVPFDNKSFDQTDLSLPSGIFIDLSSGWLLGGLGTTTARETLFDFDVIAYVDVPVSTTVTSRRESAPRRFQLTVLSDTAERITWTTSADLGTIDNGQVSTLVIEATTNKGSALTYRVKSGQYLRIPQGLQILSNGLISGRTSFDYFSLDRNVAQVTFDNTSNTYDASFRFSIIAEDATGEIYDEKEFFLTVRNINVKPFENLYLKALLPAGLRNVFRSIITDPVVNSDDMIYRRSDPYFGVHEDLTILAQAGIRAEQASAFIDAMSNYHYNKYINFGTIKKAVARNSDGTVKYEVLYVDVLDYNSANQVSTTVSENLGSIDIGFGPLSESPTVIEDFMFVDDTVSSTDDWGLVTETLIDENLQQVYSNTFANMRNEIAVGVGYEYQGALPEWMTSVQPSTGQPLGFVLGLVLAYAKPGQGDKLLYRYTSSLLTSGAGVSDIMGTFEFIADRYQWDRTLTVNYDPVTGEFLTSQETTFDRIPSLGIVDTGTWNLQNSGISNNLNSIAHDSRYGYLAVGDQTSIVTSISGTTWRTETPSVDFTFDSSIISNTSADSSQLLFPYTARISVGDEVLATDVFTANSRSFIANLDHVVVTSANLANVLAAGTTIEIINNLTGLRSSANLVYTSSNNQIVLDDLTNVSPGFNLAVKGIDTANLSIVSNVVGTTVTLSNVTTNLIPAGSYITFDDLSGNVEILATFADTAAGATQLTFASVGNVATGWYPSMTAISPTTAVQSLLTRANLSVGPSVDLLYGTQLTFAHRINVRSVSGSSTLYFSNTEQLPIGTEVLSSSVESNTNNSATWAAVSPAGTQNYITIPLSGINGEVLRGMRVVGPGLPSNTVVKEIVANSTVANLTVEFPSATVTAQSNVALSFFTPTLFPAGTKIIGRTTNSVTLSETIAANVEVGYDDIISFSLTNVQLNTVINDGNQWIAVGTRGLIISRTHGQSIWSQRLGLVYGDLQAIGYRSYRETKSSNQPTVGSLGDLWYNTTDSQLYEYTVDSEWAVATTANTSPIVGSSIKYTYIAVGNEGVVIRSTNVEDWSLPIVTLANDTLHAVAHYNGVWVAVGDLGDIITSTDDGLTWTLDNQTTALNLYDVAYLGKWVIVGEKGNIWTREYYETTWTQRNVGVTDTLQSIAFINGSYVVVGARGVILSSLDLVTWTEDTRFTSSQLNSISKGALDAVAVGDTGVVLAESLIHTVDWAIRSVRFDQINLASLETVTALGYKVASGDHLIFAQQEGFGGTNDGWNQFTETFSDDPNGSTGFGVSGFDSYDIVPGFFENQLDSAVINKRAGIWQVSLTDTNQVVLLFVRPVKLGEVVSVKNDVTKLLYDPAIQPGKIVPEYTLLASSPTNSGENTSFDAEGTRFANNRDNYNEPGTLDKYLKFPKTGVFR